MIVRMRHAKTIHAAILGGVVRTPDVLATLVFNHLPFLRNLQFGAASFGLAFSAARFVATLLGGKLRLFLIKGDFLCEVSKFLLNLLKGRGESQDFVSILFMVSQDPSATMLRCILFILRMIWVGSEISSIIH
jgi:hypothetical protein